MKQLQPIRVFEAFAGYGGASFGLKRCGYPYKVIGLSEIDPSASRILDVNFPDIKNYGNIVTVRERLEKNKNYIPDFDLFTGGFPCQPFSSAGLQLGEDDTLGRGTLIYEILKICRIKKPKFIFLENVKGFNSRKFQPTRDIIINQLEELGYHVRMQMLNTKDYGIPQNRERLWIFAYLGDLPKRFNMVPDVIPEEERPRLSAFLDKTPLEEVYLKPSQVEHFIDVHTKHGFKEWIVNEPLCFDVYNHKMKKNAITNTLTEPSHNITRIVEPPLEDGTIRVRKLSIYEQFRLMGFEDGEIVFPDDLNYSQISARAGNGWDVHLVGLLLKHIFDQL